jgi:hypothetical protein
LALPPDPRGSNMPHYRVYIVGRDGHFKDAINLDCTDDAAAVESAKQFVKGHDVEVWQEARLITKLETKKD